MRQANVNPSNVKGIIRAIEQIGVATQSSENGILVPYTGSKRYGPPTAEQLAAAGTPFFAVSRPMLIGYAVGGSLVGIDEARGVESTEPVWDFEAYSFHPYDPANPNYDDAADDMNMLWRTYLAQYNLPYSTTIAAAPSPTPTQFATKPGDGAFFQPNMVMTIAGAQTGPIQSISGDVISLYQPLAAPPVTGSVASQATCAGSYPYNARPDYAELIDGSAWVVAYIVVRAFEQQLTSFP